MNNDRLRILLKRYLNNTCSESELEELFDFLKRAEYKPDIKVLLNEYWEELLKTGHSDEMKHVQGDEKWFHEIYSQAIAREESATKTQGTTRPATRQLITRNTSKGSWLLVAAAVVVSVLMSLLYFTITQNSDTAGETAYGIKAPEAGEKVRFTLSDGTQVHLNSESTLTYPKDFGPSSREVQLEGEAYFVVALDEERPFEVHTNEITTRVLGTSFNIRSYPDEEEVVVAVTSGKVSLTQQHFAAEPQEVVLEANQWANYSYNTRNFNSGSGDVSEFTAWNEGVLLYHDENLGHVASQLERWYGVNISFENEVLKNCVIRGEHRDESLVNVLNAITYAFSMDYEIENRRVLLKGENCR